MRRSVFLAAVIALLVVPSMGCVYAPLDLGLQDLGKVQEVTLVDAKTDDKVLLLRIDGEISDAPEGDSIFEARESMVARVRDVLDLARHDENIRALVVRIDSPGGGVTASDIIYHEILEWKQTTGKPVVALFMDIAASGGYYIAQAADKIVAHPTSVTGSIGVITMLPKVFGLMEKVGVDVVVIKSGDMKDMGNPFRAMKDDERRIFQNLVNDMYQKFVSVVYEGRRKAGLTRDEVVKLADGRVYTAPDAKKARLIDEVGYFPTALDTAKALAGVKDAKVITYERKGLATGRHTIYSQGETAPIQASFLGRGATENNVLKVDAGDLLPRKRPIFNYLWVP